MSNTWTYTGSLYIRLGGTTVEPFAVVPRCKVLPLVCEGGGDMIPIPWILEKRLLA
jgi:hypothetical protein